MYKRFWNQPTGYSNTKFLGLKNGVPNPNILWTQYYETYGAINPVTSFNDQLYFNVTSQDSIHKILCLDNKKGECLWATQDIITSSLTSDIFVSDLYLCAWHMVFDRMTGEVIFDGKEALPDMEFSNGISFTIFDSIAIRPIHTSKYPNDFLKVNLNNMSFEVFKMPILAGKAIEDNQGILGWDRTSEPCLNMASTDGESIWRSKPLDIGLFFYLSENRILSISSEKLRILSSTSGDIIEEIDTISEIDFLKSDNFKYARYVVAHDNLYVILEQNIACIDLGDSDIKWLKSGLQLQDVCGVGDLLYLIENKWDIVAYDRYSGEEIWRFNERYRWQSIIPSNNKLIVYCSTGDIVCFDCGEPYISPHRPS